MVVQAYPGRTTATNTVTAQTGKLRERFGFDRGGLIGDRGLWTQVRTEKLKRHPALGRVGALRARQTYAPVESDALRLSIFDEQNLTGFVIPEYPGGRLTACYHREERRVRVYLFICLLACYLEGHLHHAWAPTVLDDETLADVWRACAPVTPANRDPHHSGCRRPHDGLPLHSLDASTAELVMRCRNACRVLAYDGPGFVPSHRADTDPTPHRTHHRTVPGIENPRMLKISISINQLRLSTPENSGLCSGEIPCGNDRRGAHSPVSVAPSALHRLRGVSDVRRKTLDM